MDFDVKTHNRGNMFCVLRGHTLVFAFLISFSAYAQNINDTQEKTNSSANSDEVTTSQSATNRSSSKLTKVETKPKLKKHTHTLDITSSTDTKSQDKSLSLSNWYFYTYRPNTEYSARLWLAMNKSMVGNRESTINDSRLTFSKKAYSLNKNIQLGRSATVVLPTSKQSREDENMLFGIEINPSIRFQLGRFSFMYLPRLSKSFHTYTSSNSGRTNNEYSIIQFYSGGYAINDYFSVSSTLIYTNNWSYSGRRKDPNYLTILEMRYSYNNNFSTALGTMTGDSVYEAQVGADSNIELYDRNSSSIYGNVALTY